MITFVRTASIAPGKTAEAVTFAKKIADYLKTRHGVDSGVSMPIAGNPNRIAWVSMAASLAQFEEEGAKIRTDPEYLALVASAAPLFMPGSVHDEIWRSL